MIRNIFYNSKTAKVDIKSQISDQSNVFIISSILIH